MKKIAIANQKGGVGKTTTSINLSAGLAQRGMRVLLIDLDPQANATSGLGIEANEDNCLYLPLLGQGSASEKIVPTSVPNLSIIPSHMDLAGVEIELARTDGHLTRLRDVLNEPALAEHFDYCLFDTPPSLGVLMTSCLAAADEILIPLQCEWFGLEGLAKIVHVIEQIRESGAAPNLHFEGILMTMFDGRTNLSKSVTEEVRNYFPEQLYKNVIPRTIRIGEAPSFGKTIYQHDPSGQGAQSYQAVADEFIIRHLPSS